MFRALTKEDILQIVDVQLRQLQPRLEEHNIELEITTAAKEQLGREGYDQQFGARPLKRKIQQLIEDPLSEGVLSGEFKDNSKVIVDVIEGQVKLVADDTLTIEKTLEELATPSLN